MEYSQNWIKELVRQEENMEASGQVAPFPNVYSNSNEELIEHTVEFLRQLRVAFTQNISIFNQLKGYTAAVRIYGITHSKADFMLFRHGYKLIFSMKEKGLISIRFLSPSGNLSPSNEEETPQMDEALKFRPADYIKGVWKPYGELKWTSGGQDIRIDYLVRYYATHFIKNSLR